jgi:hypothetical protein
MYWTYSMQGIYELLTKLLKTQKGRDYFAYLAQGKTQWWVLVNTIMNSPVP